MSHAEKVLFVDDDERVGKAFAKSARSQGYEIDVAYGAAEALRRVHDRAYAVIATDYRMPGCDGISLVEELRRSQPDATYMLVTGHCNLGLALRAVNQNGFSYVLTKPWDTNELGTMIREGVSSYWERSLQNQVQRNMVESNRNLHVQRQQMSEALARSEVHVAETLLNAVDVRGHETREHCRRVAAYAQVIAVRMGVKGDELKDIRHGALLHDIGKIVIPDSVLCKSTALSEEDWEAIRQHPIAGARVLDGMESLRDARTIVLQHHERFDGSGYPYGLSGDGIRLGARIFAVADILDGVLSSRPYRRAMGFSIATEMIRQAAGTALDPMVVEAFLQIDEARFARVREEYPDRDAL